MNLSKRLKGLKDSVTIKLNERANDLTEEGRVIYNLSSGQLPIKPPIHFIEKVQHELNFLKSYQYSPSGGLKSLSEKMINYFIESRNINKENLEFNFQCIFSNGTKHSLYNAMGAILNPDDEVILLAPYWVSYPEMIKFWGGVPVKVQSNVYDAFVPAIEEIKKAITPKTKSIIINSPNNPAGVHYSHQWMKDFAELMKAYPEIYLISDEVYSDIIYFDPKPTYFYQYDSALLKRTLIVHGISKSLASTGLRLGYVLSTPEVIDAMTRIQGQTTSGPSSLIQRALLDFDLRYVENFLIPVKNHLRQNSATLREKFRDAQLGHCWYQSTSAFYFMIDFSRTPMFKRYKEYQDHSFVIAEELLDQYGIVVVPGSDFGLPNSARISLVIEEIPFQEAVNKLITFLNKA